MFVYIASRAYKIRVVTTPHNILKEMCGQPSYTVEREGGKKVFLLSKKYELCLCVCVRVRDDTASNRGGGRTLFQFQVYKCD